MLRSLAVAVVLVAAVAVPAHAGNPSEWTVDDVLLAERAGDWVVAPDGRTAVWVRTTFATVDGKKKRVSNLWRSDLAAGTSTQLTRGTDSVSQPAFSPNGRAVAFVSTRPVPGADDDVAKGQVWVLPLSGGEAYPLTRLPRPVRELAWIDGDTLVVAAQEERSAWEIERKKAGDDTVVVDDADHEPPVRLFRVVAEDGTATRLTTNTSWIDSLAVSPDGSRAVVTAQRSLSYEFDGRVPPVTMLVDLATGSTRQLMADGTLLPGAVRWDLGGHGFYFVNQFSRHPVYRTATVAQLWYYDLAKDAPSQVDLHWERGLGRGYAPTRDGVLALLADGVRYRPASIVRDGDGWRRSDLSGTHVRNLDAIELGRDGRTLVYRTSTATTPPQWYCAAVDDNAVSEEKKLTTLNPGYAGKPTGTVEVVHWAGAGGDQVEGLLHYPLGWREGKRYPLLLSIHGGPTGVDRDSWSQSWAAPIILWRQRGAFVLEVNYHGSVGYGLDWVESIGGGRYYDLEIPDIESGVDAMIERGLVDPDRLGTTGWSNGGILSAALITRTRRYKVASIGAADVEWISDWGNVDFGATFDNYYFGGPPWEIPQVYIDKSPFFKLTEVTTPTIIYTGTEDRNVPPHQSWSLFRAMQQIGTAPVRLVLFPGEPHGLRDVAHQRRKVEEDMAWLGRYLLGGTPPTDAAVPEGSKLAALLQRAGAARSGGDLGTDDDGVLVPETTRFKGMEVGRFEVTRAQWQDFDPGYQVAPGTGDMPITGVAYERAAAYAAWLADRTGRPFRLPSDDEARTLTGTGGNTLDRWVGYTANPEDLARIRAAVSGLPGTPLLLPVGSLPGRGEPMVFDLDGNAAEWATGPSGGVAVGPAADLPEDPVGDAVAAPEYTGLRVVVGGATP